jgi:hypothetical protein
MNGAKAAYALGLRLKQLSLTLSASEGYDLTSARRYCTLASAAYDGAKPLLDSTLVYPQGEKLLERIHRTLDFASNPNHDIQPDISSTHSDTRTVVDSCRAYFESRGSSTSTVGKWFEVGLRMATVEFEPNEGFENKPGRRTQTRDKYCNWNWENKALLLEALADLGTSLDRLFPVDRVEEHDAATRRDSASRTDSPAGWNFLEIGLESYWEPAPPSGKRRCYQRDHQFLEWFGIESGSANSRYKIIAERWNAEHSESPVSTDVVKRGIKVAEKEKAKEVAEKGRAKKKRIKRLK